MRPIKVGYDAQALTGKHQTGLGVYAVNIARNLEKHPESVKMKLLWPAGRKVFKKTMERLIWEQFHLVLAAHREEVDLIHTPCFSVPRFTRIPKVVTAHDLIVLHNPSFMPLGSRWYFSKWIPASYKSADHIIAVSKATRDDLVQRLGIHPSKITVIYHGVNPVYTRTTDPHEINRIRFKYKVPADFFLMVGSFEPRKNIDVAIEAFKNISSISNQIRLVLIGKPNSYQAEMQKLVKSYKLSDQVLFPGYIPDEELKTLYSMATAFLFPSSAEGFGLPLIEAMSTGCPVIASNLKVFHEIGADAVTYVQVGDVSALAAQMRKLLSDESLQAEFVWKGMAQAMNYSWDHATEETFKVYLKVLTERGVKLESRY